MKRNLLLAAFGLVAAHLSGVAVLAQEQGEPLPIVPPAMVAVADGQPKDTPKTAVPREAIPAPAGAAPVVVGGATEFQPIAGNPFCDNCCQRSWGLTAGAGFYYLRPHWDEAAAYNLTTITNPGTPTSDTSTQQTNLSFDSSFAPKLWVAYSNGDGLTGRVSWFQLDTTTTASAQQFPDTATTSTILTLPGDRLNLPIPVPDALILGGFALAPGLSNVATIDARLRLQAIDFDLTQQCQLGCWSVNVGGGVRYARLEQSYNAYVNTAGIPGGGLARNTLHLSNVFEGVGLQGILEGKRSLSDGYGLNVYGNARAGILFGESRLNNAASFQADAAAGGPVYVVNRRSVTQDDSLPYIELEAGLEWNQNFGGLNPFARVGVVGQQWFGTGSPTSSSYNKSGDLGLFGLQVMAGLSF